MTTKKIQTQVRVTNNKDDKNPFHKKQQIAVADGTFKIKDLKTNLRVGARLSTELALKIANVEAKKLKKVIDR